MYQSYDGILEEISRRRESKEGMWCRPCKGTGRTHGEFCEDCLGQKIVLLPGEYDALLKMANSVLD